jgi:hypothetical protein
MPATAVIGATSLVLAGSGLSGASVSVGGVAQTVTASTDTQVTVAPLVASTPTGIQPIVVTTPGGSVGGLTVEVVERLRALTAVSRSATSVELTFNRAVDGATAIASRFTVAGLTISGASAAGSAVTLTTSAQTPEAAYVVVCDPGLLDLFGAPASNTPVPFVGFPLPLPTELVVLRVGDGQAALSSAAASLVLERRHTDGGLVGTLALPATDAGITVQGSSIAEGALARSEDGRFISLMGYQAAAGSAAPASVTTPRVVAIVDLPDFTTPSGVSLQTTLGTTYASTSARGAVTDGTRVYLAGGAGGAFVTPLGATANATNLVATPSSLRVIGAFGGQLFVSTGSAPTGLYQVGTGLPMMSTTATLVVPTTSPYGFALFDLNPAEPGLDTVYLADDGSGQGIKRFVKSAGTWATTPQAILGPTVRQLACFRDGPDVECFATTPTTLYRVRDTNAALPSSATALTPIGTAPANTAFRGITFAPVP